MKHILAALDGSEPSQHAAQFAVQLAKMSGARLTLLLVLDEPTVIPVALLEGFAVAKNLKSPEAIGAGMRLLEEVSHDLPAERVEKRVEVGRPAQVILEQAEKLRADHLVLGARGFGPAGRWLLGSVSDRVVHHAHCPVTVVR